MKLHPITAQSFAIIDREIGSHSFSKSEYEIIRRAIHSTADFELQNLFEFSETAIDSGIEAIRRNRSIVVDVRMVKMGISSTLERAKKSEALCALDYLGEGKTRTAAGIRTLARQYPYGIFVIGNAPTALLALVDEIHAGNARPALAIGVPVGFVAVEESKQALAETEVPKIIVRGRKGGSPVAASIVNALVHLADESSL
ncbi:MAG: precorrin-8X methylmutase [Cyanobacteria bacterium SID2]|nr:precorrin-8X methylmutase [Cyanobacteria bacterium SID2]MBP0004576.1 precorrin-8X methylmutase [Cyanobacteria bacterium SBC]